MQADTTILKDIASHQFQLGEQVHNLATIDGTKEDFGRLSFAATQLGEDLRRLKGVCDTQRPVDAEATLAEAKQQLEMLSAEAGAIQELLPEGTSFFMNYRYRESEEVFQARMQSFDIHRKQLRVAETRLNEVLDVLYKQLDSDLQHPFDQRVAHMHQQIEALIEKTDTHYRNRGSNVLSSVRFLKAVSEVLPDHWMKETDYLRTFAGRRDPETAYSVDHFYSCAREYVLGRLEMLSEDLTELRQATRLMVLNAHCFTEEQKDRHRVEHDTAYDAFFDPDREDYPRGFNDRVLSLSQQLRYYAQGDFDEVDRLVYQKVSRFLQRLESAETLFQNVENILDWMEGQVDVAVADQHREVCKLTRTHLLDLSEEDQEHLLNDLVAAAHHSAGDPEDRSIDQKGFFPKQYLNQATFRKVLSLPGACVAVARKDGQFYGGAIGLLDEVPESSAPLQERYADSIRSGVTWWMNIMPEARGSGVYDMLNDEMLIAAIGNVDVMVGRVKLDDAPSTHALRAHVKRLHIPSGGFEQLSYGLHAHLIHFVSPQLRNLYFNYLNIDQGRFEADPIVAAQCTYARTLSNPEQARSEGDTVDGNESTLIRMLLRQTDEPLHYTFQANRYFHMLLFGGSSGIEATTT